ncbi:unnamed protein product [Lepidochelys olivacea]
MDSSENSPSSRASTFYSEFSGDKCSTASSGTMICSVSGSALASSPLLWSQSYCNSSKAC